MPHTVLEFSHCPSLATDLSPFFLELHASLAETGIVELARIKGRAIEHTNCVVGAYTKGSFIFLQIALLEGRTIAQRKVLADVAEQVLTRWLKLWGVPHHCSVTVEVREMTLATHRKISTSEST